MEGDPILDDPPTVQAYLIRRGLLRRGERAEIRRLSGGVSCRVFRVCRTNQPHWVVKQALPKLQVEIEWTSDPRRIHIEADALRWLGGILPEGRVPAFLHEDHDAHVLVMEAVAEPCPTWKTLLLAGEIESAHLHGFATTLATIHTEGARLRDDLMDRFADRSVFESLRLDPFYRFSARTVPETAPFLERLCEETTALQESFVHGDYSPKNILVHYGRLVLLDHEVAHVGDPAFDIGFAMAHFLGKLTHLPRHRRELQSAAQRFWATYIRSLTQRRNDFERRAAAHILGCTLARAYGKSRLEYLTDTERERQGAAVIELIRANVSVVPDLIDEYTEEVSR